MEYHIVKESGDLYLTYKRKRRKLATTIASELIQCISREDLKNLLSFHYTLNGYEHALQQTMERLDKYKSKNRKKK